MGNKSFRNRDLNLFSFFFGAEKIFYILMSKHGAHEVVKHHSLHLKKVNNIAVILLYYYFFYQKKNTAFNLQVGCLNAPKIIESLRMIIYFD